VTTAKVPTRNRRADDLDRDAVIRKLSMDVALGDVRLPSLPDIATRVQQVLEDPRAPRDRVTQVVSADAALAARVLRLANSAFLNPSSRQVIDLQQALTRLGTQLVRCTAVSFAIQQMEHGAIEPDLKLRIRHLWREGALIAAISYVLARETGAALPDEALMTGLMHNIGELYIAVATPLRASGDDDDAWAALVAEWHPRIAAAILKHWKFPPQIIAAVAQQNSVNTETAGARLTDVLVAAIALGSCVDRRELLDDTLTVGPAFQRLGLGSAGCKQLLAAAAVQITALRAALST
jgi:HD-like signal output (HDOD) protein